MKSSSTGMEKAQQYDGDLTGCAVVPANALTAKADAKNLQLNGRVPCGPALVNIARQNNSSPKLSWRA
jgi:hypothetical protein